MLNQGRSHQVESIGTENPFANLTLALATKRARVGVVGLGYVGLPLAVRFAKAGLDVTGIDVDTRKIGRLEQGESYIDDISTADLAQVKSMGSFRATPDFAVVAELDVVIICVPTPFTRTKDPDLTYIVSAAEGVLPYIRPGQLFVLESTSFPGTTEEVVLPILTRSGLRVGHDIFLAFSPERIDPGNLQYGVHNTPKVVGGVTELCGDLACDLYATIIGENGVRRVGSPKVAEMTKLLENTYRAVNIALVNELALLCDRMQIDVWEVIDAAATKPFGYQAFFPGPGVGGHCIPVDPYYLAWKAREFSFHTRFIELAAEVNNAMPNYVVERIAVILNRSGIALKNSKILVIGAAFKPNVSDERNSPAVTIMGLLHLRRADVHYHDALVPKVDLSHEIPALPHPTPLKSEPLTPEALREADCTVLLVPHRDLNLQMVVENAKVLIDTRNATRHFGARDNVQVLWSTLGDSSGPF